MQPFFITNLIIIAKFKTSRLFIDPCVPENSKDKNFYLDRLPLPVSMWKYTSWNSKKRKNQANKGKNHPKILDRVV